jgi:hypothetical protein
MHPPEVGDLLLGIAAVIRALAEFVRALRERPEQQRSPKAKKRSK